jgi:hypothetical protein
MSIKKVNGSSSPAWLEEHPTHGYRGIRTLPQASYLKSRQKQDVLQPSGLWFWGGRLYWAKNRPDLLRKMTDSRWYCQVYWNSKILSPSIVG